MRPQGRGPENSRAVRSAIGPPGFPFARRRGRDQARVVGRIAQCECVGHHAALAEAEDHEFAAIDGVHDPEIRDLACRLWEIALEGAGRLPEGFVGEEALPTTGAFLEHFTARGRTPGDDLTELLEEDPARALEWASK